MVLLDDEGNPVPVPEPVQAQQGQEETLKLLDQIQSEAAKQKLDE